MCFHLCASYQYDFFNKKLFQNSKEPPISFCRRRPVIWNSQSLSIIRKSNCVIPKIIIDKKLVSVIEQTKFEIKSKLKILCRCTYQAC